MQHRLVVRDVVVADAVVVVGHADLEGLEGVEDVELGDGDLRQGVEPHGLADHHRIEPPGTPAPPRVGAELAAPLDQHVAKAVGQLGRNGPAPTRVMYA